MTKPDKILNRKSAWERLLIATDRIWKKSHKHTNKYQPHEGSQEKLRRLVQMAGRVL